MLLVKKCHFLNFNISKFQKSHFSKAVNPWFWSKNVIFFLFVFGQNKTRKNILKCSRYKKKTFFGLKNSIFQSPKKAHFLKGLTHGFGKKMPFFFYLFSVKIRLEKRFNNVLDRKQGFFGHL